MPWNPEILYGLACTGSCCVGVITAAVATATSRSAIGRSMQDVSARHPDIEGETITRREQQLRRAQQTHVLPAGSTEGINAKFVPGKEFKTTLLHSSLPREDYPEPTSDFIRTEDIEAQLAEERLRRALGTIEH